MNGNGDSIDISHPLNARTLIYDGLAQTDLDMNNRRLLNLDDSNLMFGSAPPSVFPPIDEYLRTWNSTTRTWTSRTVSFTNLQGVLTLAQARAIHVVGTINEGVWNASPIGASHLPTLDQMRAPLASVNLGGFKLTNVANPTDNGDAVNLAYLHSILPGLRVKEAVQCATTTQISLAGLHVVDGFAVQEGQRVLVKNQTLDKQNGIWRAHAGTNWDRAPDSDTADELNEAYCFVLNGTINANTAWFQSDTVVDVVNDPKHYVLFSVGGLGTPGPPGPGVPPDGTVGQVLAKVSSIPYDSAWVTALYQPLGSVPTGGTVGQVLAKVDGTDYHTAWVTALYAPLGSQLPTGGHAQQVLAKIDDTDYHCAWVTPLFVNSFNGRNGTVIPAVGDYSFTQLSGAASNAQGGLPPGGTFGQVLVKTNDSSHNYTSSWQTPSPSGGVYAILQTAQMNPVGTTNTVGVMMGLNKVITPQVTGKIILTIAGYINNSGAGGAGAIIRVGTGAIPANGDSLTGTQVGPSAVRGATGAGQQVPFSLTVALYPLTVGIQIWMDLQVTAASPGSASVGGVTLAAFEIA